MYSLGKFEKTAGDKFPLRLESGKNLVYKGPAGDSGPDKGEKDSRNPKGGKAFFPRDR
jgi:hypothetical protein